MAYMKDRRRFIGNPFPRKQGVALLRFLVLLAVVVFAGDFVLGQFADFLLLKSRNRFSRLYAGRAEAEILVVGDSRAVNAFYAPEVSLRTGRPCFNLAYNGVSAEVAESLLRDYFERHPPPRLVISEATALMSCHSVAAKLNAFRKISPRVSSLADRHFPSMGLLSKTLRLSSFNSEFFIRSLAYLRRDDQTWINPKKLTPRKLEAIRRSRSQKARTLPENLEAMERTVQFCKREGIALAVVMTPMHPEMREKRTGLADWIRETEDICARGGVPFFDYSRALDGSDSGFADGIHVNPEGSRALLERMMDDGLFEIAPAK
ncbi:MAG: hypothetical protein JSV08_07070 [Acidobacteriota bacterium]|nr:MAG: hypothetical protein JSV08_07070 [Acidobacteriota bacterium]